MTGVCKQSKAFHLYAEGVLCEGAFGSGGVIDGGIAVENVAGVDGANVYVLVEVLGGLYESVVNLLAGLLLSSV